MTDFRAISTIMGLAGLTAVFGMGTGVAPPVWSPGTRSAGLFAPPTALESGRPQGCGRDPWRELGEPDLMGVGSTSDHTMTTVVADRCRVRRRTDWLSTHGLRVGRPLVGSVTAMESGWSSRSAVSTGRLRRSPALHVRPIDLVVYQEPSAKARKPGLGVGFALRCFQRLSVPDLATQRCPERDSWHTRGRSSPILSY
jgi:hypothetical protein